jgi:ABC-2 type transport system permease protein
MSSLSPGFRQPGMWASVWKLLRLRVVIMVNGFRRAKIGVKIGYIAATLGFLALLAFILFISISLLMLLRSPQLPSEFGDITPLLADFPTVLVTVSAIGILLTSFSVLLQALYLSGDMDFLMSAPIPIRSVFISKLIQAVLPNFGMMALFTLPILFGLGFSGGYNLLYYPFVIIVLVMISFAAAALASLLVMVAARYFPARRLAEMLGFIIGTGFFIFSQTSRFTNFEGSGQQMAGLLKMTTRFNQPWSPLAWAGAGLNYLGNNNWLPAFGLLFISLSLAAVVFYAALTTSERLYYTGWSSLQNTGRKQKVKAGRPVEKAVRRQAQNPLSGFIPAPVLAILVKDSLVYRRDLRNISRLLTPLILGVVYAISLVQSGGQGFGGRGEAPSWFMDAINAVVIYADVALALFLGWMLASNLAGSGFSQEGKNFWILKAAPISSRQLLTAKFLVSYIPTLLICSIYVLALQILKGGTPISAAISWLAVALALAGVTGIYLAFGTVGAKFDWENPAQMNRAVGCLGSIAGMLFMPVCFGLFIVPPLLAGFLGLPILAGQVVGLLLGGAACAAAVIVPLGMVEKRVAMLNEA